MAFSGPARSNVYSPHTGLLSMVLQKKALVGPFRSYDNKT